MQVGRRSLSCLLIACASMTCAGFVERDARCALEVTDAGELLCKNKTQTRVLTKNFSVDEPIEISGLFSRLNRQYLKLENFASDKTVIVVPVIHVHGVPHYERILSFSVDRTIERTDLHRIYHGQEYALERPMLLDGFTWDRLSEELKQAYKRSSDVSKNEISPTAEKIKHHILTGVTLFGVDGSYRGIRYYKDSLREGFSPEHTQCSSNCWESNGQIEGL